LTMGWLGWLMVWWLAVYVILLFLSYRYPKRRADL